MAETINAKANSDGKVIVKLFGMDYDLTDKFIDGVAKLTLYGTDFEVHHKEALKKVVVKEKKCKAQKVDVGFIETPNKD